VKHGFRVAPVDGFAHDRHMNIPGLRSPHAKVQDLVYFGRMIDKIRLHEKGVLTPDFVENLGIGFDGRGVRFLKVNYADFVDRVKNGGSDEELLQWCYTTGRQPTEEEIEVWNSFMSKSGWNDGVSARLKFRLEEAGQSHRGDILTMFDFIDLDEGRDPAGKE